MNKEIISSLRGSVVSDSPRFQTRRCIHDKFWSEVRVFGFKLTSKAEFKNLKKFNLLVLFGESCSSLVYSRSRHCEFRSQQCSFLALHYSLEIFYDWRAYACYLYYARSITSNPLFVITEVKKRSFKKIELSFKKHSVSRKLGGRAGSKGTEKWNHRENTRWRRRLWDWEENMKLFTVKKKRWDMRGMHECVKNDDNSDTSLMSGKALKQVR